MQVNRVVVLEPGRQLSYHRRCVRQLRHASISRFIVRTNASAIPFDWGLSTGVLPAAVCSDEHYI
jgi:hypothetical protein